MSVPETRNMIILFLGLVILIGFILSGVYRNLSTKGKRRLTLIVLLLLVFLLSLIWILQMGL